MEGRAFWSYVHDDDDDDGGRISQLATLLRQRIRMRTGEKFLIFQDKTELGWGDDWKARINEALLATTFFIPIITPSYFLSEACREELLAFASNATALGLTELIMPIYYVDVPALNVPADPADEMMVALVKRFHRVNWRVHALEDPQSGTHRTAVDDLATRIIRASALADEKPAPDLTAGGAVVSGGRKAAATRAVAEGEGETRTSPNVADNEANVKVRAPGEVEGGDEARGDDGGSNVVGQSHPDGQAGGHEEDDDSPGSLDLLVDAELAFARLGEESAALARLIQQLATISTASAERIQQNDAQGGGFAGRLKILRDFAMALDEPVEELEALAKVFVVDLAAVEPMMQAAFDGIAAGEGTDEERSTFAAQMVALGKATLDGLSAMRVLADNVAIAATASKDLRRPATRLKKALLQFADTQSTFADWAARATALEEKSRIGSASTPPSGRRTAKRPARKTPTKRRRP
jgi:TIR domain